MTTTQSTTRKVVRFGVLAIAIVSVWVAALFAAQHVSNNDVAQDLIAQFGYVGIFFMAIVAGINVFLPVPAASFTPIFTAAGLWLPFIIVALVLGTLVADLLGYLFGRWSREFTIEHYPKTFAYVQTLQENHHHWLLPVVFFYAAFVPFPNEAIMIPMALVGVRIRVILLPLILGNIVNQTALAYGASNIFRLLF